MPDSKTDFLENELLDHVLRNAAYAAPSTVYVGLYTVAPTDIGGGTEVSGGSYAREAVVFNVASGGATANSGVVAFPTATAAWGTVVAMGLFSLSAGGDLLYYGNLAVSKIVGTGDTISFAGGALTVSES